jgi:hypothetical protein
MQGNSMAATPPILATRLVSMGRQAARYGAFWHETKSRSLYPLLSIAQFGRSLPLSANSGEAKMHRVKGGKREKTSQEINWTEWETLFAAQAN